MKFSERLQRLPGYPLAELPARKRALLAQGVDVIDLGAGDADYPPPAEVIAAMREAVGVTALSKYGFQQGNPAFREAACRWMERRFGARFEPATETLPLLGSKEGLSHLPLAVLDRGDVAVVPEPGYQAYLGGTVLAGGEPYVYPLTPHTEYLVELEELPSQVLDRVRLVFLNYPNNPTAAIAPREYLERTVALCRERGIVLAYDNPYCDLTFDGYRAPSIFEIPGAREVAVEFFSLSKSFSMTGWRLGWAAGDRSFITALTRVKSYVDTGPWLAVQQAGAFALDHAERLMAPNVAELQARRDAGVAALREVGFAAELPKATMYLWVPLPGGLLSAEFARRALDDAGVVVLPGSAFGPGGEGFFRIALTVGAARLREGVLRLGGVLSRAGAA
ncbi:MAG: aminotransferase class I/II-fold pyridoxal phosphate-dependent enzyme [Gemmatimonadetes bacterium]|nr:aminotransferase class I/II-fold pyridoxal phosphate-dependent enzyme [Gemmatimonadota bacterium]MBK7783618.1 aminotransferase class I/II-fold pyridoxal phosphate-dependent enzyme [Gemmatimonadota bacterium]MBK7924557.1 aminotransferase class I/II-fold pyridoxal phosphate-dependent enzyme [Gemmatimonadota bacterium]